MTSPPRALLVAAALALLAAARPAAAEPPALLALEVRRGAEPARPLGDVLGAGRAVVAFWATYCAPCRAEVPVLNAAAKRWGPAGVRVLGIGVGLRDAERVAQVAERWGMEFDTYWVAPGQDAALAALMPEGLPASFAVRGDTVTRHDRLLTEARLEALAAAHLGLPPDPR